MNLTTILFVVALITFSCFTFSYSLQCYVCTSNTGTCNGTVLQECTPALAENTKNHINAYHSGLDMTITSRRYDCYHEMLSFATRTVVYNGCNYDNTDGCSLPLRMLANNYCYQCTGDGCNPAGRAYLNVMTVFATMFVAFIVRYVWH